MRALGGAGALAAAAVFAAWTARAAPPGSPPPPPEAQVKQIVEQAIGRGGKVIMKRVDYADGAAGGASEASGGPVKSRTYIEIDSRPPGSAGDRDLIESQERIEKSQREMLRAVEAIGEGQRRTEAGMDAVHGLGVELSEAMRADAAAAAGLGGEAGDAADVARDSERIMKRIDEQAKKLSESLDDLSTRMGGPAPPPGAPGAETAAGKGAGR